MKRRIDSWKKLYYYDEAKLEWEKNAQPDFFSFEWWMAVTNCGEINLLHWLAWKLSSDNGVLADTLSVDDEERSVLRWLAGAGADSWTIFRAWSSFLTASSCILIILATASAAFLFELFSKQPSVSTQALQDSSPQQIRGTSRQAILIWLFPMKADPTTLLWQSLVPTQQLGSRIQHSFREERVNLRCFSNLGNRPRLLASHWQRMETAWSRMVYLEEGSAATLETSKEIKTTRKTRWAKRLEKGQFLEWILFFSPKTGIHLHTFILSLLHSSLTYISLFLIALHCSHAMENNTL